MFVPLHVKSDYSIGYGTAAIDELVRRAADLGYRSLALTDLENLYGQVRFHRECSLRGIRAITGLELRPGFALHRTPGTRSGRVVLLAVDASGYRSLCRIVSFRRGGTRDAAGGTAADPLPVVQMHPEGLFVLSDDPAVIERLVSSGNIPHERLGLLLVRPEADPATGANRISRMNVEDAAQRASRLGVRLVADLDAVLLQQSDRQLHMLQLAVSQGLLVERMPQSADVESSERRLRSPAEAAALFAELPEALLASSEIADCCRFDFQGVREAARRVGPGNERTDHEELKRLCLEALAEMVATAPVRAGYGRRLEEELVVFEKLGFSGFMLLVARILEHCRRSGIPVAVRGSAVSSLVLHLLGGSPVDPIAHGLLFERFLHAGKTAWPDVDIDLPWHRRDDVIAWVYRSFGEERVAMVAAHHTFRLRSALREGLKAFAFSASLIERITGSLPEDDRDADDLDFTGLALPADVAPILPETDAYPVAAAPGLGDVLPLVRRLVGRPRHIAVHPGGILIERGPLRDLLPLELAPKGVVVTQYDLVAVGQLGLVKIDLLGNRCLSEIEETLTLAGWPRPVKLADIPLEDPLTLALIDRAETVGCFQLESPAMRSLLARLPVRRQSDLIAALALIRPGAASGEVKDTFVRRARGDERSDLAFPVLADRLKETYGLPVYEEDIMLLLSRTGRLTLAEADEMRRGIVKSGADSAALAALQDDFLQKAALRYRGDRSALARARRAWAVAVRFAAYSFNKAHAASYALLAYYSAYLKTHHPLEFACALLNHHQGLYPLRIEAAELARSGVSFLGPHVNHSGYHSTLAGNEGRVAVRVGLDKVKGLSRRAVHALLEERDGGRPFTSLTELLMRVRLGSHEAKALVLCGACDGLAPLAAADYPFAHEAAVELLQKKCDPAELETLQYGRAVAETEQEKERLLLYRALVRVRNELNYLEMHLFAHPMALLRREAERNGCLSIEKASQASADAVVAVAGVIAAMRRVPTRQGRLLFVTLEDETGLLEAVLLPVVYREVGERVSTPGPFLVQGRLRIQQGAVHLEVSMLRPFHERNKP